MNACPVYRTAGGLSYGSPYMGPIGAVVSPLLWDDGRFADLPTASSLCGRCTEVCPVGIPLHRMLLELRAAGVENGELGSALERIGWEAWAAAFGGAKRAKVATSVGRFGMERFGRYFEGMRPEGDPRAAPAVHVERDPAMLEGGAKREAGRGTREEGLPPAVREAGGEERELVTLFRERAAALGVEVVEKVRKEAGDRVLKAAAAIANTGSVLLTGKETARRPLLAATRVVVELQAKSIVRHPSDLEPYLGDGDALILTGASRTADIEKQIVRGIHGAESMVVVIKGA